MSNTVEARINELGYELPSISPPVANFLPFSRTGNLLFISGQVPLDGDGQLLAGQVGKEFDADEAQEITRDTTLQLLAVAKLAIGSLDNIVKVVKINDIRNFHRKRCRAGSS